MRLSSSYYWVFLGIWIAYCCCTLALFLRLRDAPCIRFRQPALSAIASIAALAISCIHIARFASHFQLPCFLLLWIPSICFPILIFCQMVRYLRLGQMYRASLRRLRSSAVNELRQASVVGSSAMPKRRHVNPAAATTLLQVHPPSHDTNVRFPEELLAYDSTCLAARDEAMLRRGLLERAAESVNQFLLRPRHILLCVLTFVLVQCVCLALVQHTSTSYAFHVTVCRFGWEFAPFYALVALNCIPAVPSFLLCRGVNDAWGIKLELDATAIVALGGYGISLVFEFLKTHNVPVGVLVPAPHWLLVALLGLHHVNVVVPVLEAMWATEPSAKTAYANNDEDDPCSWSTFRRLLATPDGLRRFREHAAREFSVENVLFWERVQVARAATDATALPSIDLEPFLWSIWDQFIRPGSVMELNLSADTAHMLNHAFAEAKRGLLAEDAYWEERERRHGFDNYNDDDRDAPTSPVTVKVTPSAYEDASSSRPSSIISTVTTALTDTTTAEGLPEWRKAQHRSQRRHQATMRTPDKTALAMGALTVSTHTPRSPTMADIAMDWSMLHHSTSVRSLVPMISTDFTMPYEQDLVELPPQRRVMTVQDFVRAEEEVLRLMYESTYPRFLVLEHMARHKTRRVWQRRGGR